MTNRIYKKIFGSGIAAALIFSPIAGGATKSWALTPLLLIEAFLIFAWLWNMHNQGIGYRVEGRGIRIDKPIILFGILAIISFIFSIYKYASFYALLELFGYIGVYYIVTREFGREMMKRVINIVIILAACLSLYGILQYLGIMGHPWWNPKEFLASTFVNHNHFAGYLELVIPVAVIALARALRDPDNKGVVYKSSVTAALVVMIAAFIIAQSRGAWISLSMAFLIGIYVTMRKKAHDRKAIVFLVLFTVLMAALVFFSKDIITQRVETISDLESDTSSAARIKIWQGACGMIMANPLTGTGIGTFEYGFSRYRPEGLNVRANFAHNEYLNMAAEMGIAAGIIMLWLFAMAVQIGLKRNGTLHYSAGFAIGVLSLALHGVVDFNFHIPANMLLFTVWLAFIATDSRTSNSKGAG